MSFKILQIFKTKDFSFESYIQELGFNLIDEYPKCSVFRKGDVEITVYFTKDIVGHNKVSIDILNYNIVTLKFIPKSKTMTDIMLNQVIQEINESQEEIQQVIGGRIGDRNRK